MTTTPSQPLVLVECPRDAMQGLSHQVPTDLKIRYLQALLAVGFHTLDAGSFVSAKAIPQMADSAEVLAALDLSNTPTRLLAIVLNERGAQQALALPQVHYLGYPLSLSATFQMRNARQTPQDALDIVQRLQELCTTHNRELVLYLSMGFGNPYGDPWSVELLEEYADRMARWGIGILSLADTVGTAQPADVQQAFGTLTARYPHLSIGAHFHAQPHNWQDKIAAAYLGGCRRFDGALGGFGGCPFADDHLTGNIATENILAYLAHHGHSAIPHPEHLPAAQALAQQVFHA